MQSVMTLSQTSLAWLTLGETGPLSLIRSAHEAGFGRVGLKVVPNPGSTMPPIVGNRPLMNEIKSTLAETDISVVEMGGVWISPDFDPAAFDEALETGRELGAQFAIAAGSDPVQSRLVDHLAALTERAERVGLRIAIEFISFSTIPDLRSAYRLSRCVGQAGCGILVDVLHLARSGGTCADISSVPRSSIFLAHLCDAPLPPPPDLRKESRQDRLLPGQGQLPLLAFLDALPADVPLEIEAPVSAHRSLSKQEVAMRTAEATIQLYSSHAEHRRITRETH